MSINSGVHVHIGLISYAGGKPGSEFWGHVVSAEREPITWGSGADPQRSPKPEPLVRGVRSRKLFFAFARPEALADLSQTAISFTETTQISLDVWEAMSRWIDPSSASASDFVLASGSACIHQACMLTSD